MFVRKVLISLTLVATIPAALSRHVSHWGTQVFPDDAVAVPSNNIEDLGFAPGDIAPGFESRKEQREVPNDLEGNVLEGDDAPPDFRDDAVKLIASKNYAAPDNRDFYDVPVSEDDKQGEDSIIPEVVNIDMDMDRASARMGGPKIIVVERPDDEQQFPENAEDIDVTENEIPHGDYNYNNDNNDSIDNNEIPDAIWGHKLV